MSHHPGPVLGGQHAERQLRADLPELFAAALDATLPWQRRRIAPSSAAGETSPGPKG
ncbi:hypothetical protein [Streptomyces sp. NPDC088246]|uniref:hypothetical protein n=1 Tax=Streptomyces sp. NPDC088246 TaxID=3365842 RepID=UPI00382C73F6